ncbi:MAG: protein-export chaperone SecB [Gammaproteobacteria bacterium]|nr:protein-export chaperone SecB [Gammaproteobacteria bacterium]
MVDEPRQSVFNVEKVYLKDASFESPKSPAVFKQGGSPEMDVQLNHATTTLDDNRYEAVLALTITATQEDQTVFLVEVHQAGIFHIADMTKEQMQVVLGVHCPHLLFPYARQIISELTTQGGFPPLLLAPVNFEALYHHHLQQKQDQQPATTH